MARVETIVKSEPELILRLRPEELWLDAAIGERPGPTPENEQRQIKRLVKSFRDVGQLVPLLIDSNCKLIDGRRRREAALQLDSDEKPFLLKCVVIDQAVEDPEQASIHANMKRRGYTPLQLAHLFARIRKQYRWKGTKEVAEFCGVSRAQVSQHDKLLEKPADMPDEVYEDLLEKISSGRIGSETAFYTLTNILPEATSAVMPRAEALAIQDASAVFDREVAKANRTTRPSASNRVEGSKSKPQKLTAKQIAEKKRTVVAHAKIEKKHVVQAAREQKVVKKETQKTIPEALALLHKLDSTAYADPMRNLASFFVCWLKSECEDADIIRVWGQVAMLVEQQLERKGKTDKKTESKVKAAKSRGGHASKRSGVTAPTVSHAKRSAR